MKNNPQQSNHQFRLRALNKKWHLLLLSIFFLLLSPRFVFGQSDVKYCFDSLTSNCILYYSAPPFFFTNY